MFILRKKIYLTKSELNGAIRRARTLGLSYRKVNEKEFVFSGRPSPYKIKIVKGMLELEPISMITEVSKESLEMMKNLLYFLKKEADTEVKPNDNEEKEAKDGNESEKEEKSSEEVKPTKEEKSSEETKKNDESTKEETKKNDESTKEETPTEKKPKKRGRKKQEN